MCWAPIECTLHVICALFRPGRLSLCVGDSLQRSEEIVKKNLKLRISMRSSSSISVWQHVNLSEQIGPWDTLACCWDVKQQSLEFIRVTRILAETKMENRGKSIFSVEKINKHFFFFPMKIKMMDLWTQVEGTKPILALNFSVLDFFKFA